MNNKTKKKKKKKTKGSPELAQSQQGSPVPTFAAMPWKIALMWGLWKGKVKFSSEDKMG
jgi:hypothetical protein